ncbi:MAG: hypothetical protein ACLSIF_08675 [Faecalimonas umbilicata]
MKKFYYLVRMTFLEKMAYTKAVWFNTIGTLVSIFSYYFLWKIVFMGENELVGFTMGGDDNVCHFVQGFIVTVCGWN